MIYCILCGKDPCVCLREAFKFFFRHAGYSTPPGRAACTLELAKAEAWAKAEGAEFEWLPDDTPWDGDCEAPEELLGCVCTLGDETVSLWGIGDPSPEYRRVVEAELAMEIQAPFFEAVARRVMQL